MIKEQMTIADFPALHCTKPTVICSFLRVLGFYEISPTMYKLPLPTTGTYLLSDENGSLWMEYDEGHGDNFKQSVGFGKFEKTQIAVLVSVMQNCI